MKSAIRCCVGAAASLLIMALISSAGLCCCSGLLVIPTASTVGDGQYSYEYQTDGLVRRMAADTRLLNNEIGIGDRLELGFDIDADRQCASRLLGNGKYTAYQSPSGAFAASVGVLSVAHHWKTAPFVVATQHFESVHLHLGAMQIEGDPCCIVGLDRELGKLTLMCDYTSGSGAISSVGANYQFSEGFGIMAGALMPRGEDAGFTLHFVWCQSLGRSRG